MAAWLERNHQLNHTINHTQMFQVTQIGLLEYTLKISHLHLHAWTLSLHYTAGWVWQSKKKEEGLVVKVRGQSMEAVRVGHFKRCGMQ